MAAVGSYMAPFALRGIKKDREFFNTLGLAR